MTLISETVRCMIDDFKISLGPTEIWKGKVGYLGSDCVVYQDLDSPHPDDIVLPLPEYI